MLIRKQAKEWCDFKNPLVNAWKKMTEDEAKAKLVLEEKEIVVKERMKAEQTITRLKSEISGLQVQVKTLKSQAGAKGKSKGGQRHSVESMKTARIAAPKKGAASGSGNDVKQLHEKISQLEGELAAAQAKTGSKGGSDVQKELLDLQTADRTQKAQINQSRERIQKLNLEMSKLKEADRTIKNEKTKLTQANTTLKKENEDLKKQLDDELKRNGELGAQVLQLQTAAKQAPGQSDKQITTLTNAKTTLEKQNATLKAQSEKDEKEILDLKKSVESSGRDKDAELTKVKNELASTKKLLESANSEKQSDAKTLQTDKTRVENELDKTSKELASVKAELQSVRESAQRANAAAGGAKALQAEKTRLETDLKAAKDSNAKLQAEIEKLKSDVKQAQDATASASKPGDDSKLKEEKTKLETDLKASQDNV